jgi:hypothetical protein
MEKLTDDQMENLVGGSENPYCGNLYISIWGGNFQGSDELLAQAVGYFDQYCSTYNPPASLA